MSGIDPLAEVRSGFAALVGRPNTGKSTLVNALVGSKVAIVSDKPQTTRNRLRAVLDRPNAQIVFVDTPGLHIRTTRSASSSTAPRSPRSATWTSLAS